MGEPGADFTAKPARTPPQMWRSNAAMKWQIGAVMAALLLTLISSAQVNLTAMFLRQQDLILLGLGLALLAICGMRLAPQSRALSGRRYLLPLAAMVLALACLTGHTLVLGGYDMSRDEQMVIFDAAVFRSGHLTAALPALWRDAADALNTSFMIPAASRGAWVSAYLPGNAALHAVAGSLTAPLLSALGLIALWGCVRRLWPEDRELPIVALLLYIGSGQVVVTGMTAYAMSGHLALNLVWLWLFLRRHWRADVAALAVGFLATGLHQPLMHPMFAAPILFLCLIDRQWHRAALYLLGYAVICAFWLWWPGVMWGMVQASADATQPAGVDYASRLMQTVMGGDGARFPNMLANLLRFAAWQHLLLLPLFAMGIIALRGHRLFAALAAGVGLTALVMTVILPYQGHGFGYRYLHGLIGSVILVALHGWKLAVDKQPEWRPLLIRTTVCGLALTLALQVWMAHRFYAPYARASAAIEASDADYAVIDPEAAPFAQDLVINQPDLSNRPIRLDSMAVKPQLVTRLCQNRARVAFVSSGVLADIHAYFTMQADANVALRSAELSRSFAAAGCRVSAL
ncbi:MAG: hypothetical protein ABL909_08020 [Sphingopyxis sp.]